MLATIVAPGFRYQLTDNDLLWAGRMVYGESQAEGAEVLWTMTSRFAKIRGSSFADFIRTYSQPINPKWYGDGVCCAQGATGCPARPSRSFYGEENCSERVLARRARISSTPWDALPAGVRATVMNWATALQSNPVPRAVDFAAPDLVARKMQAHPERYGGIVKKGLQWYVSTPDSKGWAKNHVTIQLGSRVAGDGAGVGIGVLLVGGVVAGIGAAWAVRKMRQRRGLGDLGLPPDDHNRLFKQSLAYADDHEKAYQDSRRCDNKLIHFMLYQKHAWTSIAHAVSDEAFREQVNSGKRPDDQNKVTIINDLVAGERRMRADLQKRCLRKTMASR